MNGETDKEKLKSTKQTYVNILARIKPTIVIIKGLITLGTIPEL